LYVLLTEWKRVRRGKKRIDKNKNLFKKRENT
jgi:hypothetical protein